MNCRIDFPTDDLQRFAPNLDFLASLIAAKAPADVRGSFTLHACVSGVQIEFAGSGAWRTHGRQSPIIPRWMFCDVAFRELIAAKAAEFMDAFDRLSGEPDGRSGTPENHPIARWLL